MNGKFPLGHMVITPNALSNLHLADVRKALDRHVVGDWGDICDEDKAINEQSLTQGGRLMSTFTDSRGTAFWIITEADRSATTVLLPEDY